MYVPESWDLLNPYDTFGVRRTVSDAARLLPMPGLARAAGPGVDDGLRPWQPGNALFVFGAVLLLSVAGVIGASTRIKAGPYQASAELGTT